MESTEQTSAAPQAAPATPDAQMDPFALASQAFMAGEQGGGDTPGEGAVPDAEGGSDEPATPSPEAPSDDVPGDAPDAPPEPDSGEPDGEPQESRRKSDRAEVLRLQRERDEAVRERDEAKKALEAKEAGPPPAEAWQQRIRARIGLDDSDGKATVHDLERMTLNRDYAGLAAAKRPDGTVGYSFDEALDQIKAWKDEAPVVEQDGRFFEQAVLQRSAVDLDGLAREAGLDPVEAVGKAAEAAKDGSKSALRHLVEQIVEARVKSERAEGAKPIQAKLDKLAEELARERAAFKKYKADMAGSAEEVETGGRSAPADIAAMLASLSDEEFTEKAIRGEFAGVKAR